MGKEVIRLTENDLHIIVRETVNKILKESEEGKESQNHIYSEKEMKWLYDNQNALNPLQQKVLKAGMWVRAMQANYHGYAKRWPNIKVENGEIFYYDKNGEMKRVPFR